MNKQEIGAVFVCEQTTEPQKVKINYISNTPGLNYIRFQARLQTYNVWNRNNRNYKLEPMKKTWAAPHIAELEKNGTFCGEYGHPISNDPARIVTIDPKLTCHRIVSHEFRGNSVYGIIETLSDDMYGKAFMQRTLQGVLPAFSIRALVPLTKIDAKRCEIRSPGHLVAVDAVILPSHADAYADKSAGVEIFKSANESSSVSEGSIILPEGQGNTDYSFTVESMDLLQYIVGESTMIKNIVDEHEIAYESASLNLKNKTVVLKEGFNGSNFRRTAIIGLDEYVKREVDDILSF